MLFSKSYRDIRVKQVHFYGSWEFKFQKNYSYSASCPQSDRRISAIFSLFINCCECPKAPEALWENYHQLCFHLFVNRTNREILIYTVNYSYFICEWNIICLLHKWSIFVVLFNVFWLQINTVCMFLKSVFMFILPRPHNKVDFSSSVRSAEEHLGHKDRIRLIPFCVNAHAQFPCLSVHVFISVGF